MVGGAVIGQHELVSVIFLNKCRWAMKSNTSESKQQVVSRRKFVGGAAKALPLVVAASSSKSVWASSLSLSGALSGNLSGKTNYDLPGTNGNTPGFWKEHPEAWPLNTFPGLMVFKGTGSGNFNLVWDWTESLDTSPNPESTEYYAWQESQVSPNVDATAHNGTYATTWAYLGLDWDFLTQDTIWESLATNGSGDGNLEYHFAAALLNASHSGVDYGYSVTELVSLIDKAVRMGSTSVMSKITEALVDLNERDSVDASDLTQYEDSDLYTIRTTSGSGNSKTFTNDLAGALGSDDSYPTTFQS